MGGIVTGTQGMDGWNGDWEAGVGLMGGMVTGRQGMDGWNGDWEAGDGWVDR